MELIPKSKKANSGKVISAFVTVVVGLALYPVLISFIAGSNATGAELLLANLVGTLYIIMLIAFVAKQMGISVSGKKN